MGGFRWFVGQDERALETGAFPTSALPRGWVGGAASLSIRRAVRRRRGHLSCWRFNSTMKRPIAFSFLLLTAGTGALQAQSATAAWVRHAPVLEGTVTGSLQLMIGESVKFDSAATITGDLLVPGNPALRLSGSGASIGGTAAGTGSVAPSNYTVTLDSGARLGRLVTRTDPSALPVVAPAPAPVGTRSVSLSRSSQSVGDFPTLRNLTLNGNVGTVSVPPGVYGNFTANGTSGFVLGVSGATAPSVYSFQRLTLNAGALSVVGPVVVTVAESMELTSGIMGNPSHANWLTLRLPSGGLAIEGPAELHGLVIAPNGTVEIGDRGLLAGNLACDRLILDHGTLRVAPPTNLPPKVVIDSPAAETRFIAPASFEISAAASDPDGTITKVEFFMGETKMGEVARPPFRLPVSGVTAGVRTLTARATDNNGAYADSPPVKVTVGYNQPPVVSLISPAPGSTYQAPATINLAANATDPDGTINQVEFFQGTTRLGVASVAPFKHTVVGLGAGSFSFTARATDNANAVVESSPVLVSIVSANQPPVVSLTSPAAGAVFNFPSTVQLAATASDPDGGIAKVEFFQGASKLGEALSAPFGFSWSGMLPGSYALSARAVDKSGLSAQSAAAAIVVQAALPYRTDFESTEGYALGSVDGQGGWKAGGPAEIIDAGAYHGARALSLTPANPSPTATQLLVGASPEKVIFADLFVKLAAGAEPASASGVQIGGAKLALVRNGSQAQLHFFSGDAAGGGQWRPAGIDVSLNGNGQAADWLRITTREDPAKGVWDLGVNGRLVTGDIPVQSGIVYSPLTIAVKGDDRNAVLLDDLLVGSENPLFPDNDFDGMDDAWERSHGLNPNVNDRNADPDGDGRTNFQEFVAGTDPQDYFNGNSVQITSLVPADGALDSQGTLAVRVTTLDGRVMGNAPVSAALLTGGAGVALAPGAVNAGTEAMVRTDAKGIARFYISFGPNPAVRVRVSAGPSVNRATLEIAAKPTIDGDGNGLPDPWEIANFGFNTVAPDADPDGDGLSNLQEFQQGTDPNDFFNGITPVVQVDELQSPDATGMLVMVIRRPDGTPWPNAPASFLITAGDRKIAATPGGPIYETHVEVRTDAAGVAKVYLEPL